jgi:hypothetical protein
MSRSFAATQNFSSDDRCRLQSPTRQRGARQTFADASGSAAITLNRRNNIAFLSSLPIEFAATPG